MQKTHIISLALILISVTSFIAASPAHAATQNAGYAFTPLVDYPTRLLIPAIALSGSITQVGVNSVGQMAVSSGKTQNVGWYKAGTVPGQVGSAVLDAHVFAAFTNLYQLRVGSSIYVQTAANKTLRFVVSHTQTYTNADVPLDTIFNKADAAHLNLITCAGTYNPKTATYDSRLIVYATLVS